MIQTRFPLHRLALAACLALTACGGGGGASHAAGNTSPTGSGSPAAKNFSMKGSAVDGPIANALITITAGAPLGDPGATTIGTATADASGNYTVNPTLPSGSVPVFANVADPNNPAIKMSSYVGQSDTLAAAGTLDSTQVPNLNVTPITTAALAVYAQHNANDYTQLSPSTYADALTTYNSTVVSIASAIKAIGDNLCKPSTEVSSTLSLASQIAQVSANANGAANALNTAINTLGAPCSNVLAELPNVVAGDPSYANQLTYGTGTTHASLLVAPGTYTLEGVVMQNGLSPEVNIDNLATAAAQAPADVVANTQVTVGSDGKITSSDGNLSGTMNGPLIQLTLIDPTSGVTYDLRGSIEPLPAASVSGTAYALRANGTYASTVGGLPLLGKFDAVLASPSATPIWNGMTTAGSAGTTAPGGTGTGTATPGGTGTGTATPGGTGTATPGGTGTATPGGTGTAIPGGTGTATPGGTATPAGSGTATPGGTALTAMRSAEQVDCTASQLPLRLDVFGPEAGSFGVCISATPTSWTFNAAQPSSVDIVLGLLSGGAVQPPSLSAGTWTALPSTPFILSLNHGSITLSGASFTGTGYHVMGSRSLLLSTTRGTGSNTSTHNITIAMHGPALDTPPPLASASDATVAGAAPDATQSSGHR